MNAFQKIVVILERHYYGDLLMAVCELVAIVLGLKFSKKLTTAVPLVIFLIVDLLVLFIHYYIQAFLPLTKKQSNTFISFTNVFIYLAELLVYYNFFFSIIHNRAFISTLKVLRLIFLLVTVAFMITGFKFITTRYSYVSLVVSVMELLLLIPPCLFYFLTLIKDTQGANHYQRPSFWVVAGVFVYAVMSIPYYLIDRIVVSNNYHFWRLTVLLFFNIPISINCIFLTKAFLFKKPLSG